MKKQILGFFVAITLAFSFTGCVTSNRSTSWEYKVAIVRGDMFGAKNVPRAEETINTMTREGWSLVSTSAGGDEPKIVLVFKKKK